MTSFISLLEHPQWLVITSKDIIRCRACPLLWTGTPFLIENDDLLPASPKQALIGYNNEVASRPLHINCLLGQVFARGHTLTRTLGLVCEVISGKPASFLGRRYRATDAPYGVSATGYSLEVHLGRTFDQLRISTTVKWEAEALAAIGFLFDGDSQCRTPYQSCQNDRSEGRHDGRNRPIQR